jgi:hypothetical protein
MEKENTFLKKIEDELKAIVDHPIFKGRFSFDPNEGYHSLSETATRFYNRNKTKENSDILNKLCHFTRMYFDKLPISINSEYKQEYESEDLEKQYILKVHCDILMVAAIHVIYKNNLTKPGMTENDKKNLKEEIILNFWKSFEKDGFKFDDRMILKEFSKITNIKR